MNSLEDILAQTKITVREYKTFKYKGDAAQLFKKSFLMVDKTIKTYHHLPEYDHVIDWIADSKGKGLLLTGSLGRGKSVILNGVIPLIFRAIHNKVLKPVPARSYRFEEGRWGYCIDDIGQEGVVNDYGTKLYSVADMISDAEDQMKLVVLSSNLTKSQLSDKYGDRIVDRLSRLCKTVVFNGNSFR